MEGSINSENNQQAVKYTSFDDLTNELPILDEAFLGELIKAKESTDWKLAFDYLDVLRKINKFHPEDFAALFPKVLPFILSNVGNLRSNLIKNGLVLMKEVFNYNPKFLSMIAFNAPDLFSDFIPLLYEKANNDKAFLKNEAKEALKALEKSSPLHESILKILLGLSQEKSMGIAEKAGESLNAIINLKAEEILAKNIGKETYALLIKITAKLLDSSRMTIKKQGDEILGLMMKTEDFETRLEEFLEKKEKDLVVLAIENRKKAGAGKSKESLKDFISKKKQN